MGSGNGVSLLRLKSALDLFLTSCGRSFMIMDVDRSAVGSVYCSGTSVSIFPMAGVISAVLTRSSDALGFCRTIEVSEDLVASLFLELEKFPLPD